MADSGARGATIEDLAFIEDICRDIALKTRSSVLPYPAFALALGDSLIVHRATKDGRTIALATAIDRGRELDLFLIAVSFSQRRTGIAGELLDQLTAQHLKVGKSRRIFANCWPGSGGGPGALLAAGFSTAPGKVRWTRDAGPTSIPPAKVSLLQWNDLKSISLDRRARLLGAVGAAWPGDADPVPVLAALSSARDSQILIGLHNDEVKAVLAGVSVGDTFHILLGFEIETGHGEGIDGGLAILLENAKTCGVKSLSVETAVPTARTAPTLTRLGFRSVEAAAGFLAGTPGHAFEGNAFAL